MYSSSSRIIDWLSQSGSEIDDATPVNPRKRPISPASSDAMEQKPGAKRARVQPQFDAYSPAGTLVSPEDDEEAIPRRRNPAPSDAQSSSAASSQQTSDSFDSAATPSERRKKSRGIAFASSSALQVVFSNGTEPEPAALRLLVRHFALVRREKHFCVARSTGESVFHSHSASVMPPTWSDALARNKCTATLSERQPLSSSRARRGTTTQPHLPRPPRQLARSRLWRTSSHSELAPPLNQLHDILISAQECEENYEPESEWNCVVHSPLLRLALHDARGRLRVSNWYIFLPVMLICMCILLLSFADSSARHSTSATINSHSATRGPTGKDSKKVDFCIVLCQPHPKITDIIDLGERVNHTDHDPYIKTPIAISIVTKGRAPDQEEAILQLGTWFSAHFSRLRVLFMRQSGLMDESKWEAALEELCFLPGLMVFQHEWYLVAATLEPQGLKLWRKVLLGSTQTIEGICEVVYGVRRLAVWAEERYWPWFRRYALGDADV
jgi:hypothetical protein